MRAKRAVLRSTNRAWLGKVGGLGRTWLGKVGLGRLEGGKCWPSIITCHSPGPNWSSQKELFLIHIRIKSFSLGQDSAVKK